MLRIIERIDKKNGHNSRKGILRTAHLPQGTSLQYRLLQLAEKLENGDQDYIFFHRYRCLSFENSLHIIRNVINHRREKI